MSAAAQREAIEQAAAKWIARRDAGLSPAAAAELDRWLAADPRHAAAFAHYGETWSVLDRPGASRSVDAVLSELGCRTRRRRQHYLAAAACMLAGVVVWKSWPTPIGPAAAGSLGASIVRPVHETRTLADGSTVELRPGAEINVQFSAQLRRVVLVRGEAHFQVAKDAARPFAVEAGVLQVRAVGTAFLVQRDADQIEVLVTEGRIAIETNAAPADAATPAPLPPAAPGLRTLATMAAGERVTLAAGSASPPAPAVRSVSAQEVSARLAWRAPRVEFSDTPLAEAVALMNRAALGTGAPQLVLDPGSRLLAREPVSGLFRADQTEAFVRVLELSLGVESERRGARLIMRRPE